MLTTQEVARLLDIANAGINKGEITAARKVYEGITRNCSVKTMRTPMVSTRKRISLRKADSFHTSMKSWRGLRRGH